MTERVDLLGDDLVHVERTQSPIDVSLQEATNPAISTPATRPEGLCSLCREKAAQERCLHCGNNVCREHFWIMLGLCKSCATEEESQAAKEGPVRARPDLDIKWVEE